MATVGDLAKAAVERGELGTFDYALPLDWVEDVAKKTGERPVWFVWSYPKNSNFGRAFPLTPAAAYLLARYEAALRENVR